MAEPTAGIRLRFDQRKRQIYTRVYRLKSKQHRERGRAEILLHANLLLLFVMIKRVVASSKTVENIGFGFDNDRMQYLCWRNLASASSADK